MKGPLIQRRVRRTRLEGRGGLCAHSKPSVPPRASPPSCFETPPRGYALSIEPAAPREAEARYLQRYHVLSEAAGYAPTPAAFDTE